MTYLHIFAHILCINLVTPELFCRHKGVVMHMAYRIMHIFSLQCTVNTAYFRILHANFCFVMYLNQQIHVIIGAWCTMMHRLILVAPPCLRRSHRHGTSRLNANYTIFASEKMRFSYAIITHFCTYYHQLIYTTNFTGISHPDAAST